MSNLAADDLYKLLLEKFGPPAYALFAEVGNSTGYAARRWADAVAMSLWPSRGLSLHGFELKVSRSDWVRERDNPAKSSPVQQHCDYWWLVVADKAIVEPGELPETWGLLAPGTGRKSKALVVVKEAPKLASEPLDRAFLAAFLRRAAEREHRLIGDAHQAGFEKGQGEVPRAVEERMRAEYSGIERDRDHIRTAVKEFEKASGVTIDRWNSGRIGEAVREVMALRHHWHGAVGAVNLLESSARKIVERAATWRQIAELLQGTAPAVPLAQETDHKESSP